MTREEFLSSHWKAYPAVLEKMPSCFMGRVIRLDSQEIVLKNQRETLRVTRVLQGKEDSSQEFGSSIPVQYLLRGDVVAYDQAKQVFYLLSPCLSGKETSSQQDSWAVVAWSEFLEKITTFFKSRDFVEIRTPYLVASPGVDHHIDFLKVEATSTQRQWCLPTSPEIYLKKSLCRGFDRVFEIKHCFRDDLLGSHHRPEFLMMEWYRSYEGLGALKQDLQELVQLLATDEVCFTEATVAELFWQYAGFKLSPQTRLDELRDWAGQLNIDSHESDDWNDLFFRIFMDKIEPHLGQSGPLFVSQFPASQASLAQINAAGWSERFELYWQGVELANAYLEVNSPKINMERFQAEKRLRELSGKDLAPFDDQFFKYLEEGMPPASGIALGLDRLFMVLRGESSIHANAWQQW